MYINGELCDWRSVAWQHLTFKFVCIDMRIVLLK